MIGVFTVAFDKLTYTFDFSDNFKLWLLFYFVKAMGKCLLYGWGAGLLIYAFWLFCKFVLINLFCFVFKKELSGEGLMREQLFELVLHSVMLDFLAKLFKSF